MKKILSAFTLALLIILAVVTLFAIMVTIVHADPIVIMTPGKGLTYVYPGTKGMATVIIPPQPAPLTYVYPGTPLPTAPMTTLPTYVPAPFIPMPGGFGQ